MERYRDSWGSCFRFCAGAEAEKQEVVTAYIILQTQKIQQMAWYENTANLVGFVAALCLVDGINSSNVFGTGTERM